MLPLTGIVIEAFCGLFICCAILSR
jgi:hypothetical protein